MKNVKNLVTLLLPVVDCLVLFFCQHSANNRHWPLTSVIVQGSHDCPSALVADLEEFIIFGILLVAVGLGALGLY